MKKCTHDLAEQETACADGMCPLCLAQELAAAKEQAEAIKKLAVLLSSPAIYERAHQITNPDNNKQQTERKK